MFEIHVGKLRATFLRNHNMRRHKDPKRKTTQAEDNSSTEDPHNPDSRHNRHKHGGTAPVTWRCTRYVAVHPNRRGALPTDRVQRPNTQEQTRNWHTEPLTATPLHAHLRPTGGRTGTPPTPPPALRPTPTPPTPLHAKSRERHGTSGGPATSREALRTAGCGPGFGQRALAYRSTECPDAAEVRMASTTRRLSRASSIVTCSAPTPRIASRKRSCSRARGSRLVRA